MKYYLINGPQPLHLGKQPQTTKRRNRELTMHILISQFSLDPASLSLLSNVLPSELLQLFFSKILCQKVFILLTKGSVRTALCKTKDRNISILMSMLHLEPSIQLLLLPCSQCSCVTAAFKKMVLQNEKMGLSGPEVVII